MFPWTTATKTRELHRRGRARRRYDELQATGDAVAVDVRTHEVEVGTRGDVGRHLLADRFLADADSGRAGRIGQRNRMLAEDSRGSCGVAAVDSGQAPLNDAYRVGRRRLCAGESDQENRSQASGEHGDEHHSGKAQASSSLPTGSHPIDPLSESRRICFPGCRPLQRCPAADAAYPPTASSGSRKYSVTMASLHTGVRGNASAGCERRPGAGDEARQLGELSRPACRSAWPVVSGPAGVSPPDAESRNRGEAGAAGRVRQSRGGVP